MRQVFQTTRFKRDLKRAKRRDADLSKLVKVIDLLVEDISLPTRYRPHKLSGNWQGYWECHIEPDWLLIYDLDDEQEIALVAMGSHADLFK